VMLGLGCAPMEVYVDITRFAESATMAQLRERIRALEGVGVTGVTASDHLFGTQDGRPRSERSSTPWV